MTAPQGFYIHILSSPSLWTPSCPSQHHLQTFYLVTNFQVIIPHKFCIISCFSHFSLLYYFIIGIQPLGRFGQRPELSQATGTAFVHCIPSKFLGVVCHCFPPAFRHSHFCHQVPLHLPVYYNYINYYRYMKWLKACIFYIVLKIGNF